MTEMLAPPLPVQATPLLLTDLRLSPAALLEHLVERIEGGDALNAFLLAAGLRQVVEDVLEADALRLADAQRVLGGMAARAARAVSGVVALARRPMHAGLRGWDARLGLLLDDLADAVATAASPAPLGPAARALAATLPSDERLERAVTRPPTSFRDFDQHPDDLAELAARLRASDPAGPIVVAGLRTSGSYLAPLTAAYLRVAGDRPVTAISVRPFVALPPAKREALRSAGTVVLTDDAPSSGGSIAAVAASIERLGVPPASIVLALQLLDGDQALPAALERYPAVLLAWPDWSVHRRLQPEAVAATLRELQPDRDIEALQRIADVPGLARGHCGARYGVTGADGQVEEIEVTGAGLGYLGTHALAVERALDGWVVPTYGVVDGLAYRPVPATPLDAPTTEHAAHVARYTAARSAALTTDTDPTGGLGGQDPVWEVAANLLAQAFARAWRPVRLLAVDAIARELLAARRPAVIDGRMSASSWFEDPARKSLVKANAAERTFSNRNLAHADVAFDVASAGVAWPHLAAEVRTAFAAQTGEAIDAERWFVLRLVALWAARRDGELSRQEERRACSRVLQDYIAEVYLDDLPAATTGPLCGIDLDGVLETETLGFLGTSPAGGRALRALRAHDFRAVLVSGRSAGEVAERCRAYGLAGGVAEYGAATCSGGGADVRSELTGAQTAAVEAARAVLVPWPGVEIGSDHSFIVRAWTRDAAGRRCPLPREAVAAALACGPLRSIDGDDQTDLVPVGADKATGMRALADRLSTDGRLALAVGDTAEDLPMLGLASVAVAPRNASAAVRDAGVRIARRSYQAGTAEAVGHLIGHEPGGCPQCRAAESGRQRRRVLRILAARERGRAGLVAAAVTLVLEAHRP